MFSRSIIGKVSSAPKLLGRKQFYTRRRVYYVKSGFYNRRWKTFGAIFVGAGGLILGASGLESLLESIHAQDNKKRRIVVLGSGWGAVSFLKNLKPGVFDVAIVSPTNYFLFTPFLPSVTVGTVEGRTIVEPIRKIIGRKHKGKDCKFYEAECYGIDAESKKVMCKDISGKWH